MGQIQGVEQEGYPVGEAVRLDGGVPGGGERGGGRGGDEGDGTLTSGVA